MSDPAANQTDALIAKMEKRIHKSYAKAEREMKAKAKAYSKEYNEQRREKRQQMKNGEITHKEYKDWKTKKAYEKQWYDEMVNQLAEDATLADAKAMSMVKGYAPEAYAINRNYSAYEVETGTGVDMSFTLYDSATVERLIKDNPKLLPNPSPDIPKDQRWNQSKITSAVTQSVLQGESADQLADRIGNVVQMDEKAAIRTARTAMTGAQNAGRLDTYKHAEKLGIKLQKEWMSTLDARTRESHRMMDGETAEINDEFSNGLQYPGDTDGDPEEFYNCRCTMVSAIEDLDYSKFDRYDEKLEGMSYDEWKWQHDDVKKYEHLEKVAQHKLDKLGNDTYSGIWKDDVKLSDYAAKKGSIPAKQAYYEDVIYKFEHKELVDGLEPWEEQKLQNARKNLDALKEYEKKGKQYEKLTNEKNNARAELKKLNGSGGQPANAFSEERKNAAYKFTSRREADRLLRPQLDNQWNDLTNQEKYSVWKYTENSNPINKPLSGYTEQWNKMYYEGVGNVDWGREDNWRMNPKTFKQYGHADGTVDHAKSISNLTTGIEKCEMQQDIWLVRGSDANGFAGLLEGQIGGTGVQFDDVVYALKDGDIDTIQLIAEGNEFRSHSFMSTGIARDSGFSGEVKYEIYCPKGTKAIYAEPQSHYGDTISRPELYTTGKSYGDVGHEAEVIIQRGSTYRITSIEKEGSYLNPSYRVKMEIVEQPDYFTTGYEQTIDNGATSFVKRR